MTNIHLQAQRVLDLLVSNRLDPTPSLYEFFYHYVTETDPGLVAAVDDVIKSGRPLSTDIVSRLRRQFFGAQEAEDVQDIVDKTNKQIDQLSHVLEVAGGDARSFSAALGVCLPSEGAPKQPPDVMIDQIVKAAAIMAERTQKLEAQLNMSSQEVNVLRRDLDKARTESRTDPLTGLPNRKAFQGYLEAHAHQAREDRHALSLLFCDVDHFKIFNDTWGHRIGDEVLRLVAQALEQLTQGAGYPARYGGEEFVIVLPHRNLEEAHKIADEMREFVSNKALRAKQSNQTIGRVTLSFGVAQMAPHEPVDSLIERADQALYKAKEAGRNCVVSDRPPAQARVA